MYEYVFVAFYIEIEREACIVNSNVMYRRFTTQQLPKVLQMHFR